MGRYKKSRFQEITIISDTDIPRDPNKHPTDMMNDMNQILSENSTPNGAWYIAKCTDESSPPSPISGAKNKYYAVYYATDQDFNIIVTAKRVAAPCPPFCNNDNPQ